MSLIVPVAAWPAPPQHRVSALLATTLDGSEVVSGGEGGEVCLWGSSDETAPPGGPGDAATAAALTPRVPSSGAETGSAGGCANLRGSVRV